MEGSWGSKQRILRIRGLQVFVVERLCEGCLKMFKDSSVEQHIQDA